MVFALLTDTNVRAAVPAQCPDVPAIVFAERTDDFALACSGADDAIGYMAQIGLDVNVPLEIHIRDQVTIQTGDGELGFPILGKFERRTEVISVTSVAGQRAMASQKPIMGVVYDPVFFRSVVAHEVAHAIAHRNFEVGEPSHEAHEYIAFVVQFETMPAELRERILASRTVTDFESEYDINAFVYHFSPDVFAIKVARYHRSPKGGVKFVKELLQRDTMARFAFWMMGPEPF